MNTSTSTKTGEGTAPEASGTIAREFIQCSDKTGRIGSFLATNSNRQVSPTFNNLSALYTWARDNGWKSECGAYIYNVS